MSVNATVRDVVKKAWDLAGREKPGKDDMNEGLVQLNAMIGSLSIDVDGIQLSTYDALGDIIEDWSYFDFFTYNLALKLTNKPTSHVLNTARILKRQIKTYMAEQDIQEAYFDPILERKML